MQATFLRILSEFGLQHLADQLLAAAAPAIQIVKAPTAEVTPGSSHLGGLPDVPEGFAWPTYSGRPLTLLAQLDCAEIAPFDAEQALPAVGLLHFFYDIEEQPWGYDPEHRGGAVVRYTPHDNPARMQPAESPPGAKVLPSVSVGYQQVISLPTYGSADFEALHLNDQDLDPYLECSPALRAAWNPGQSGHQLLGHAFNIQGDMQIEAQLVSHGVYCGVSGDSDPRAKSLKATARDWRLLLQFDQDDPLGMEWGDDGKLYFWIRNEDLRARQFDQTWTILQCH